MKQWLPQMGWIVTIGALLIGVMAITSFSAEPTKPAAYLATATYITSGKCKMCHNKAANPIYTNWSTTMHGKLNAALPWEKDGKVPEADVVYRHTTGYNAATKAFAEKGVACEACHGPGSAHMKSSMKPEAKSATIFNPVKAKTAGEKISVCGRCHGQYTIKDQKFAADYFAGQDLTLVDGFKLDPIVEGKKMQEMNELMTSTHFAKDVTCISCHAPHMTGAAPHSLKKAQPALCLDCHKDKEMAKHAPHAAADATCATCHMPKGAHTFVKPAHH